MYYNDDSITVKVANVGGDQWLGTIDVYDIMLEVFLYQNEGDEVNTNVFLNGTRITVPGINLHGPINKIQVLRDPAPAEWGPNFQWPEWVLTRISQYLADHGQVDEALTLAKVMGRLEALAKW